MSKQRLYNYTLADLIDALSILQIKTVMIPQNKDLLEKEINKVVHDIDLLINENKIKFSAKLIRVIIIISQINLHIWMQKDKMKEKPDQYDKLLRLAHQLNGIRNRMKNSITVDFDKNPALQKTNTEIDGLKNWDMDLK